MRDIMFELFERLQKKPVKQLSFDQTQLRGAVNQPNVFFKRGFVDEWSACNFFWGMQGWHA
jgi:hypothetical protein